MADDNKVEVKFGAQTSEIEAGSKKAADAVKGATDQMKGSLDSVQNQVKTFHADVKSGFEGITASIAKAQAAFVAIGAVLAGGKLFKGAIDTYVELNSEVKKVANQLGVTIPIAHAFVVAHNRIGITTETVSNTLRMFVKNLIPLIEGFLRFGRCVF